MPSARSGLLASAIALSCQASTSSPIPEARAGDPPGARGSEIGVAVVELFTSEGCSSCPPAEAVLERVADGARAAGRRVIPLAFHVDYWDELGWRDRFASPAFTARQRDYARAFGAESLYTPQMIVGGVDRFVGSDGSRAGASIAQALARHAAVRLVLAVARRAPDAVAVHYELPDGVPDRARLWIAVAQRSATVHVDAGENAGRTLHHTDTVRALAEASLRDVRDLRDAANGAGSGDLVIRLPWTPEAGEAQVTAVLQRAAEPGGMAILGAETAAVPP
jgi:hypothetical protein